MSGKSNRMAFNASDVTMPNCGGSSSTSSTSATNSLAKGTNFIERNKKWQMELLMERLRSKSAQYKPLQDTSRNIRIAMLEKRYGLDMVEKSNLQKCLDRMQYCIKVTTRQGLVERLESLSRQLGLKFSDDNLNLFISSDMFYLEIILDSNGKVHDVKVHHEFKMEQQSCQELVSCLLKGDFADFTAQLEGLTSIYQLNADKKTKSNAFVALQALESDLQTLYSLYVNKKDPNVLVQSPVGILQPRRGGHPMRLTYFVSPYQLLDVENSTLRPLTVELIHAQSSIGLSVTVHLEAASSNKLQITPIVKVQEDGQGNRIPEYKTISADNSIMLPAYFVLRLNKPIVIGVNLLRQIEQITRAKFPDEILSKASPILSLIGCHGSDGQITNTSKGLFVSLTDQTHCYFLTENNDLTGVVIKSIPFIEPSHVPQILFILRQQSLFNTLITSCIRTSNYKSDIENTTIFEISVLSCQHISITLEHPYLETMATIELDLTNMPNIKCNIFALGGDYNSITSGLSRILQTCASIPITVRMLIKYWEREHLNKVRGLDNNNLSLFCSQPGNTSANNVIKAAFSDLENGTIKNRDVSKHREFSGDSQPQQRSMGDDSSDGKATKRRRSEEFDYFRRNDATSKDISKVDMFARVPRIDSASKDANNQSSDGQFKSSQRLAEDTFRNSDELKSSKLSKANVDCDKVKVNKSESYDPNGKRLDGSEPVKKKQKRPRDEKSSDSGSNLSSSVSITPIASMQSSVSTSLSTIAQSTSASSSATSNLSSVLGTSTQNLPQDHWPPLPSQQHQQQQSMYRLERRLPSIEIIPISSQPTQNLKSSITITPINSTSKNSSSAGASSEKRTGANNGNEHSSSGGGGSSSSSKRSSDSLSSSDSGRLKLEKKKKRKREDSPMGPPEKMPVTVSIKTSDGSPISPSGQQLLRKFNSSPVLQQSSKISLSSTSSKISPKHSPLSGSSSHSSPKHQSLPSPKGNHYSTSSPKHSSSAGSGKPSMSTLKSATSSPNSKSSIGSSGDRIKTYSSSSSRDRQDRERDRDRDKDRDRYKYSSGSNSPKLKAKLSTFIPVDSLLDASSSSQDSIKSSGSSQANKNRKSSLSAVIDKLKSARHVNDESPPNTPTLSTPSQSIGADANNVSSASTGQTVSKEKSASANTQSLNLPNVSSISITSVKNNSEYMVKHSSDGMKITINKTRTKDMTSPSSKQNYQHSSSSSSSGSGSNSPKTHTGLKPGVNSGPASKKPHASFQSSQSDSTKDSNGSQKRPVSLDGSNASNQLSSSNSTPFNSSSSISNKSLISKSSSSGSLNSSSASLSKTSSALNSSSSLPKSSTNLMDNYKKDKNRFPNKSGSGNGNDRPPTTNRDVMKLLGLQNPSQTLDVFGKTWDTKYQIPKLSARSSANDKDTSTTNTSTVAASPLNTHETNSNKSMVNFMSSVHSFGGNQMLSNKIHGGRASSVSPKYNLNTDSISNFNKDIHIYKSSSSDALQHQSQSSGHHIQLPSSSGNNAFASLLPNKSPLHHSTSVNTTSKNLLSGTSQLSGSSKNSIINTGSNIMGTATTSPSTKDLINFQDQMKKNRLPSKPSDNFASSTNSLMNPNQMRNMQSSAVSSNQSSQAAPLRRPVSGNSPQQTFSKELSSDNNGSVFWA
ncbi:mediator of RNA polymerase II transcription subunit 1 isoform X3 [Contarinia nasturtii]|uniref:mediator of RNA polymerase II transcription subunit 1 isoform X3 n=1 Tax=Contarinia nasturtii TaxID=265458 RepID=UPI0012D4A920|nr:mediator of RNA polymerase II transcription subunit 1 isoform X3 [Contarinia nasturtii]